MRRLGSRFAKLAFGLIVVLAMMVSSQAGSSDNSGRSGDHDRARQALEAGEILPLKTVLERLARDTPGQVMEVELERHGQRWIYEIKLLRPGGALSKLLIDARDGTIIANREHGAKR